MTSFEIGDTLSVLRFLDSACFAQSVNQISWQSLNEWSIHCIALNFQMAAAAMLENGAALPVLRFTYSACFS
jgi:hypothetical protein